MSCINEYEPKRVIVVSTAQYFFLEQRKSVGASTHELAALVITYLLEPSVSCTLAYKTSTEEGSSFIHSTPRREITAGSDPRLGLQIE